MPAEAATLQDASVPWGSPATIGVKRKREAEYMPEISGLKLAQALEYVRSASPEVGKEFCIWVRHGNSERLIAGDGLLTLLDDANRRGTEG